MVNLFGEVGKPSHVPVRLLFSLSFGPAVATACLAVGAAHCLFYGILFAPLFAEIGGVGDLPHTVWTAAALARDLALPYPPPSGLEESLRHLGHYGVSIA